MIATEVKGENDVAIKKDGKTNVKREMVGGVGEVERERRRTEENEQSTGVKRSPSPEMFPAKKSAVPSTIRKDESGATTLQVPVEIFQSSISADQT